MSAVTADMTVERTDRTLHITKWIGSTTYKVSVHFSRTSRETMDDKLTILYERLSHEDGWENESLSIEHQKEYLGEFAARNGFTNIVHRTDDDGAAHAETGPDFCR